MTTTDFLYLALIAIVLLLDGFVLWPAYVRRSQADPGRARTWLWLRWMVMLWTLVAAGVVVWLIEARAWALLRLVVPHGWRLWGAVGLALVVAMMYGRTVRVIARSRKRIKVANPGLATLVPHTRSELGWWVALSVSAGFCEEFIFRGYLMFAFQPMLGLWGAAACAVVVFALAHAYQGAKGIIATGLIGALLTLVVLITGSLLPAMVLHAQVDIGQGMVAWVAFQKRQGGDAPVATAGASA